MKKFFAREREMIVSRLVSGSMPMERKSCLAACSAVSWEVATHDGGLTGEGDCEHPAASITAAKIVMKDFMAQKGIKRDRPYCIPQGNTAGAKPVDRTRQQPAGNQPRLTGLVTKGQSFSGLA